MRANCVPFPISPRNSAVAVAHLINKVQVKYLLVGHDQAMSDLAQNALELLAKDHPSQTAPVVRLVPTFDDFMAKPRASPPIHYHGKLTDTAFYFHSSGM